MISTSQQRKRGKYGCDNDDTRANIAWYAIGNDVMKASRRFSVDLDAAKVNELAFCRKRKSYFINVTLQHSLRISQNYVR